MEPPCCSKGLIQGTENQTEYYLKRAMKPAYRVSKGP
jgi:hypothetical protein